MREYARKWRVRVIMFLGGKRERCGNNDSRVLQVDHVNGGGNKERQALHSNNASTMAKRILNFPENYQLLCANCNWIKRWECGECS